MKDLFRATSCGTPSLDDRLGEIADALASPGYLYLPDALDPDFVDQLATFLAEKELADELERAGVGKGHALQVRSEIRSDSIYWLDAECQSPAVSSWLQLMEETITYLRRALFLPIETYEGHLAKYPAGGYYKPHLDQHRLTPTRQITIIAYLNPNWDHEAGGQLRLYTDPEQGIHGPYLDFLPQHGSLIIFRSADFWHEVLLSTRPRISLTGWFRGREENPLG